MVRIVLKYLALFSVIWGESSELSCMTYIQDPEPQPHISVHVITGLTQDPWLFQVRQMCEHFHIMCFSIKDRADWLLADSA